MILGLTDKVVAIGAGALSITLAGGLIWQTLQVWNLEEQISAPVTGYQARLEAANRNLGTCTANTATLEQTIREQNTAIEAARTKSEARIQSLQRQLAQSDRSLALSQDRAAAILEAQPTSGDLCADALDLLKE